MIKPIVCLCTLCALWLLCQGELPGACGWACAASLGVAWLTERELPEKNLL